MQPDPTFRVFFLGCVFLNMHNMSFSVCIKGRTKEGRAGERGVGWGGTERRSQNYFVNMTFGNIPCGKGVEAPRDIRGRELMRVDPTDYRIRGWGGGGGKCVPIHGCAAWSANW